MNNKRKNYGFVVLTQKECVEKCNCLYIESLQIIGDVPRGDALHACCWSVEP
jgi:hypothetical protein